MEQEEIRKNFSAVYFSIKNRVAYPEVEVPQLKDGREILDRIDAIEREKSSLLEESTRLDTSIDSLKENEPTTTCGFFPCLATSKKGSLLTQRQKTEYRLKDLASELQELHTALFTLYTEILPIKFKIENPVPSRAPTPILAQT